MLTNDYLARKLIDDRIAALRAEADAARTVAARRPRRRWWPARRRHVDHSPADSTAYTFRRFSVARPPAPYSDEFGAWATALADEVAATGIGGVERAVAAVVRDARRHGLGHALVDVLADRSAPAPARERALGRLLVALAGSSPSFALDRTDHTDRGIA